MQGASFVNKQVAGEGGGSIDFTAVNRLAIREREWEPSTDVTIPAGWFYLSFFNSTLNNITIIVGGVSSVLKPGRSFNGEDRINWPEKKQEFGQAVTIMHNGESITVKACFPNSSGVDLTSLP